MFTKYKMRKAVKRARRDERVRNAKIMSHKGESCRNYTEQDLKEIESMRFQLYSRYNDNKINVVNAEYSDLFGSLTLTVYFLDDGMLKALKDSETRETIREGNKRGNKVSRNGYANAVKIELYPSDLSQSGGLDNVLKSKLDTYTNIERIKNNIMEEVRYNNRKELDKYL